MSGLSKLANQALNSAARFRSSILFGKLNSAPFLNKMNAQIAVQSRGSHGRTMFIRPGKFYTKKYMDMLVIYFLLVYYTLKQQGSS